MRKKKCVELFKMYQETKIDLIVLQETHSVPQDLHVWEIEWGGKIIASHYKNNARGTMILINKQSTINVKVIEFCDEGRYVIIEGKKDDYEFMLCGIYAPNKDDPSFFAKVENKIDKTECANVIVIGDFNLTQDSLDCSDRSGSIHMCTHNNDRALETVNAMCEKHDLVDPWRLRNPCIRRYSWHRRNAASRIDFVLMNQGSSNKTESIDYTYGHKTDHSQLELILNTNAQARGAGYWKLNSLLLHDMEYVQLINDITKTAPSKYPNASPDTLLELWKMEASLASMNYSKEKAQKRRAKRKKLSELYQSIKSEYDITPSEGNLIRLQTVQTELAQEIECDTRAAMFRSRSTYHEYGERSSKYYFSLEKRNGEKKCMTKLHNHSGNIITDPEQICDEQHHFYSNLYSANDKVSFDLINNGNSIDPDDKEILESPITLDELTEADRSLNKNKCPGGDGFPSEFYQFFWSKIKFMYFNAITYAIQMGTLHFTAHKGIITLIPKKKDPIFWPIGGP